MSRIGTNLTAVLISIAIVSTSFANPFLDKKDLNDQKKNDKTPPREDILKQHLPPLPTPPTEKPPQTKWSIDGRVNNKVIVTDGKEERLIDNGDYIEGCIVQYPALVCGEKKDEIARLLKTISKLKQKVTSLQDKIKKLKAENAKLSVSEKEKQQQIDELIKENSILQAKNKEHEKRESE